MGCLMGSKGLKAIVVPEKGDYKIPIQDKEKFKQALKRYFQVISEAPQTSEIYPKYGTSAAMDTFNQMGALPTLNWRSGSFEEIDRIGKEALYSTIKERGGEGKTTHRCMPGCPVRCYNKYPDKEGRLIVSPLQYETMALMGSNLGISDLDAIARFNYLCNDIGVDTVELAIAIGMVMEKGLLRFGDPEDVTRVIKGIGSGDSFSKVLSSGAVVTGKVFGIDRVPAVKGQGLPAHEPRAVKGMGVTLSMTPMGADHTTGVTFRQKVDHHKPDGQVDASLAVQLSTGGYDVLGICFFTATAVGTDPMLTANIVNAVYGTDHDGSLVNQLGKRVMLAEKTFNEAAGFTKAQDRLPEFFRNEKLPPFNLVYDVPQEEMDEFWDKVKSA
jgi:aldehyde:ferredoxin oxidoreductase